MTGEDYSDGLPQTISVCQDLNDSNYDVIVLVADKIDNLPHELEPLSETLRNQQRLDAAFLKEVSLLNINLACERLVVSPTGPLNRDYDDARRWKDAGYAGVKRALRAGCSKILVARVPGGPFPRADEATLLGAFHALYTPLELREDSTRKTVKATSFGFFCTNLLAGKLTLKYTVGIEKGRLVSRDLGGSDPERMCPLNFKEYVCKLFQHSSIKVDLETDQNELAKEYPLFAAVNRCTEGFERYQGCVINLEYVGEGAIEQTLMIVGKGVTYDTGGYDVKAGKTMAGMHRDKCGAAALAGLFKVLDELKPRNIKVVGALSVVRNAISVHAYVADELITARSGARVQVSNTDAEGRMVMADVLCKMKERALKEVNPHLMTWATLTGHSRVTYGNSYAAAMDNGPARRDKFAYKLQEAGDEIADMIEVSILRREDYEFHAGKSEYADVHQAGCVKTPQPYRGHQGPGVFLILASGLDKHGIDSDAPLKYTHLDMPNHGPFPGIPTAAPIAAMAHMFVHNRL